MNLFLAHRKVPLHHLVTGHNTPSTHYQSSLLSSHLLVPPTAFKIHNQPKTIFHHENPSIQTIKTFKSSSSTYPSKLYNQLRMMGSSKRLSEIIEKWRKRKKGHFAVYTKEGRRFVVPLDYLNHPIFRVLLEMAEEEFGTTIHGPLRIPCEEELMLYVLSLLRKNYTDDADRALVSTTSSRGASISSFFLLFYAQNQGECQTMVS